MTRANSGNILVQGGKGRLVKFLTTSMTLTVNEYIDITDSGYLTNDQIRPGNFMVFVYGGGGSGGESIDGEPGKSGGGGGQGGCSFDIVEIDSDSTITIGAGGSNGDGGTTSFIIGGITIQADGGTAGEDNGGIGGIGGAGSFKGLDGHSGDFGGSGENVYGGETIGTNSTYNYGGRGSDANLSSRDKLDGGDGYVEIYEWDSV